MITVACVYRPGVHFDATYVRVMRDAVLRNLTVPHDFVCLTDSPDELPDVHTVMTQQPTWGIHWNMLELFRPGLFDGEVLYFDLDTFIIGNIDFLAECHGDALLGLEDFNKPGKFASGMMRWRASAATDSIYQQYLMPGEAANYVDLPFRDEAYISHMARHRNNINLEFFQKHYPGKILSYKVHILRGDSLDGVSVVCCHGTPKPRTIQHPILSAHWTQNATKTIWPAHTLGYVQA